MLPVIIGIGALIGGAMGGAVEYDRRQRAEAAEQEARRRAKTSYQIGKHEASAKHERLDD